MGATAAVLLVAGLAFAVGVGDDSDQLDTIDDPTATTVESSTSSTSPSTTSTTGATPDDDAPSTTTSVIQPGSADPDATAAADFLDAWSRGDREAMLEVADPQAVDLALDYFGSPASDLDCTTQTNGQLDCEVETTSGRWAYFLIGQPGAADGQIWWLSETAPGEGGGP